MKTSAAGIALIKEFEGCVLSAYRDAAGVWTIGYGHTSMAGPPAVSPGLRITQAEADDILTRDLEKYEREVERAVTVPLNQHQFDALVSFHFNTGAIGRATLTKRLNAGQYDAVPGQLARWNKAGGRVLNGLTRRREMEAELWNEPVAEDPTPVPSPPPPVEPEAKRHWLAVLVEAVMAMFRR